MGGKLMKRVTLKGWQGSGMSARSTAPAGAFGESIERGQHFRRTPYSVAWSIRCFRARPLSDADARSIGCLDEDWITSPRVIRLLVDVGDEMTQQQRGEFPFLSLADPLLGVVPVAGDR